MKSYNPKFTCTTKQWCINVHACTQQQIIFKKCLAKIRSHFTYFFFLLHIQYRSEMCQSPFVIYKLRLFPHNSDFTSCNSVFFSLYDFFFLFDLFLVSSMELKKIKQAIMTFYLVIMTFFFSLTVASLYPTMASCNYLF